MSAPKFAMTNLAVVSGLQDTDRAREGSIAAKPRRRGVGVIVGVRVTVPVLVGVLVFVIEGVDVIVGVNV